MNDSKPCRFVLRDLSLPSRFVLAAFLVSVGIGYFAALVQLHFQGASAGKPLPTMDNAVDTYAGGGKPTSQLERVLMTDEHKPFSGSGSMRSALTTRSSGGWKKTIAKLAKDKQMTLEAAEKALRAERYGEASAIVAWINSDRRKDTYENDEFPLPPALAARPITARFVETNDKGVKVAKIKTLFDKRCARCHDEGGSSSASEYPLGNYEQINVYCDVETTGSGMSLKKLAQTTHVHLLGFAMLYGLTGLIFTFTSYPRAFRLLIGPSALLIQLVDISCWWLARLHPTYAQVIVVTGGLTAACLGVQIVLSLFNLFGKTGKAVLLLLIAGALFGAYELEQHVISPYLTQEGMGAVPTERTERD